MQMLVIYFKNGFDFSQIGGAARKGFVARFPMNPTKDLAVNI
jgi:hypothetical protein